MIGQLARRALFQLYSGGVRTGEWAIMIVNAATATQFRALLEEASAGKAWCGTARSAFRATSSHPSEPVSGVAPAPYACSRGEADDLGAAARGAHGRNREGRAKLSWLQ